MADLHGGQDDGDRARPSENVDRPGSSTSSRLSASSSMTSSSKFSNAVRRRSSGDIHLAASKAIKHSAALMTLESVASTLRDDSHALDVYSDIPPSPSAKKGQESVASTNDSVSDVSDAGQVVYINRLPFVFKNDEDTEGNDGSTQRVYLLVIAMKKKVMAKPMQNILKRLATNQELVVAVLDQSLIFEADVEDWPICDCLIAFYSTGYPLEKAERYVALRQPFLLNDLAMQHMLLNRCDVYRVLEQHQIPVPAYVEANLDLPDTVVEESEDAITVNGATLEKPFVMKPIDAEDHSIYVFFNSHDGGGAQHLFRKKKDRASEFLPDLHNIPKSGHYVFEKFMTTGGTDIKVYTIGPNYAHAEGRKAPVLDGQVLRDPEGKELRCPILLSAFEKDIAKRVVQAFGQNICGFDLLRTEQNKSYVCDVNGWSFVKRSVHYYDDCARIVRQMILEACAPNLSGPRLSHHLSAQSRDSNQSPAPDSGAPSPNADSMHPELRCVVAVIRHGDRTPKEKLKAKVKMPEFLELFRVYGKLGKDGKPKELKLKTRLELQDVLARTKMALNKVPKEDPLHNKLLQVESVLTRWPISGINRKFQLKPLELAAEPGPDGNPVVTEALIVMKWGGELTQSGLRVAEKAGVNFRESMYPSRGDDMGLLRLHSTYRHDLKLYSSDEGRVQMTAAAFAKGLLQLTGEITPIVVSLVRKDGDVNQLLDDTTRARHEMDQVKHCLHSALGTRQPLEDTIRTIVPDSMDTQSVSVAIRSLGTPLDAMDELRAILDRMCDDIEATFRANPDIKLYQNEAPVLMMARWRKLQKDLYNTKTEQYDFSKLPDIYDSVKYLVNHNIHLNLKDIPRIYQLSKSLADIVVPQEYGLSNSQKVDIARKISRPLVEKIIHDLRVAAGRQGGHERFKDELVHRFDQQRGRSIKVKTPSRHVRTRLYFTSESHIHALVNLLRFGNYGQFAKRYHSAASTETSPPSSPTHEAGASDRSSKSNVRRGRSYSDGCDVDPYPLSTSPQPLDAEDSWQRAITYLSEVTELNYLTHIVCRLFERPNLDPSDPRRYFVEWLVSPGERLKSPEGRQDGMEPLVVLHSELSLDGAEQFFKHVVEEDTSSPDEMVLPHSFSEQPSSATSSSNGVRVSLV